jgi:hypothetical protein
VRVVNQRTLHLSPRQRVLISPPRFCLQEEDYVIDLANLEDRLAKVSL